MNTKPELLAPAGGWEQLKYAIHFGADAVYLASDKYGMRQRADNFSLEEIPKAISYAHEHNVAVYVTINTVMHDEDLDPLNLYLQEYKDAHVDAFIVHDLGALSLAKTVAPEIDLHISTQASVCNSEAAKMWKELGAKRIVCARELSLEQIKEMRARVPQDLELECFVHGSMCMSYSGRCLISDFVTERSSITGNCTQPCRWKYTLEEEKRPGQHFPIEEDEHGSYIMNAQDLCMIEHLDELKDAGVSSLKIEGRNKKAFYVASVVNAYRQVLDGANPSEVVKDINCTSHRPLSTGFYFGNAYQSFDNCEYERQYEWVAEVLDCEKCENGWDVLIRCRNKFEYGDELEVMTPGKPSFKLDFSKLRHVPNAKHFPDNQQDVDAVNRTMQTYRLQTSSQLYKWDIIRKKK